MIGKKQRSQPTLFIPGSIEDFIPDDHILKRVARVLDLSWLRGEVASLYCDDNGRPGIDPEAAVRLMLAGFFHGIVHDRKLMREAQVNIAIRWFAGYSLEDKLPDHSSLTRIRQRWGADLFRRIFTRTVAACAGAGLVSGETVHIDATLIRADVSWESLTDAWTDTTMKENAEERPDENGPDRSKQGRPPTRKKQPKKRSTTDPDATLTTSSKEFRMEPCYKQHTAVDDKAGVIVDIAVTTGETSEGGRLMETIERVEETTGNKIERVTADAAYAHSRNYSECEERGIDAVIPPQRPNNARNSMPVSRFKYDAKNQTVRCPAGHNMPQSYKSEKGMVFRMGARTCSSCPHKTDCLPASAKARTILIVDGYEALLRARRRRAHWDAETAESYKRHRWRVEGVHGEAKTQHGLRRAVRRGMDNVSIQAYMTAAAINLKRLAAFVFSFFASITSQIRLKTGLLIYFNFFSPVCFMAYRFFVFSNIEGADC
jgi:transposase